MKIMFCHDGSERSKAALEKALGLFKHLSPEVFLITVVEEPLDATSHDEESFEKWRATREEDLQEAANRVVEHGLDVDAILAIGDPRKMIIEAAENKNPDILVVARRGAGLLESMVLGSVSSFLVRHAECPVLVIHS
ncbi:MAG: universal stress protein [Deltaproteobacteria bacterium]|nr:universal stress protein [Deltaproteobacteria bacterium]MBZ0220558.1 universal stress protein [Deltaproteobacteria bacterium]